MFGVIGSVIMVTTKFYLILKRVRGKNPLLTEDISYPNVRLRYLLKSTKSKYLFSFFSP